MDRAKAVPDPGFVARFDHVALVLHRMTDCWPILAENFTFSIWSPSNVAHSQLPLESSTTLMR